MIILRNFLFLKIFNITLDDESAKDFLTNQKKFDYLGIITRNILPNVEHCDGFKHKRTVRINFSKDKSILQSFKKEAQSDIKRSKNIEKHKIVCSDDNFKEAFKLYKNFEKSQGRRPSRRAVFKHMRLFSAYKDDELVSAMFCTEHKPVARLHSMFSKRMAVESKKEYRQISWLTKRLVYETCRYYREQDFNSFDLGSVNFQDPKIAGINKFKLMFSSDVGDEFFYIFVSNRYKLASMVKNYKQFFRNFFTIKPELKKQKQYSISINNEELKIEVLIDQKQKNQGLAGRKNVKRNEGALIVNEREGYFGDVIRNMKFPVDLIWIDSNHKIIDIKTDIKPTWRPRKYVPQKRSRYFLEVPSGFIREFKIKERDEVNFSRIKSKLK